MAAPTPPWPRLPTHTHTNHEQQPPTPPHHSFSTPGDSRYSTPSAEGLQRSHCMSVWRLFSCNRQESRVGATPLLSTAQHGSARLTFHALSLIIYDILPVIINSSELHYIPDAVQTLSHLWRLLSPAGPVGVSSALSINPPPSLRCCFSPSLIGFCLWVLWSVATVWSVLLPPKV